MFKAEVKVSPTITVEMQGETPKELFTVIANIQEICGEKACGLCKSNDVRLATRTVKGKRGTFTYYENACNSCHARLAFGQSQDGKTLFPKRKLGPKGEPDNDNGSYGKHNGWTHYRGEEND